MKKFLIKKCTLDDIEKVKYISENTFYETFAKDNSKEDMESYLKENFSYQKIKCEIENDNSIFFIVQNDDTIAAYMKVNFNKAQTEIGHKNTLEIQRIYVLNDYKGKSIGKMLIEKSKRSS